MPPVNCSSSASRGSSPSALPSPPCWRRCARPDGTSTANSRLLAFDKNTVSFKYKDYRLEGPDRYKVMTLAIDEFIRRFLIHVLPKGLHRIRHYGLFAKAACADNIARARQLLGRQKSQGDTTNNNDDNETPPSHRCPCCGGRMIIIEVFERGSTPRYRPAGPIIAIRIDTS